MKLSAILGPLLDAKADHELIRKMIAAHEEAQADALEHRRETDRKRQAEKRSRDSRDPDTVTRTVSSHASVTRVEDNLQTRELAGQEERKQENAHKARGSDLAEFKAELSPVLDAERIEAVIKHRRSKRGQITGLSARLFLADANACGLSPSDAVDTCISRNWITVKPEYLNGNGSRSTRSTGPPPRSERSVSDVLGEMAAGTWTGPTQSEPDLPTIETSFHRRN